MKRVSDIIDVVFNMRGQVAYSVLMTAENDIAIQSAVLLVRVGIKDVIEELYESC